MEFDIIDTELVPNHKELILKVLTEAQQIDGSDVFILPGAQITVKSLGSFIKITKQKLLVDDTLQILKEVYALTMGRSMDALLDTGDDDFSFSLANVGRFRCNAYRQRGSYAAVLRVVPIGLPNAKTLNIPDSVMNISEFKKGLILITGSAGSGKSTTLACIIDYINSSRGEHIITIEDPIEFLYKHKLSLVSQREVNQDSTDFQKALRASLRQAPDVILLGEMRDYETMQTALTAAETGHLLLSTMHTIGASKTVDRMIDVFPAEQQQQVRVQLSMVLQAVVSQQLIPTVDNSLVPAFEIMFANRAIKNMIREGKVHQIDNVIATGNAVGMQTMDNDLFRLYKEGRISRENAILYAIQPDILTKRL